MRVDSNQSASRPVSSMICSAPTHTTRSASPTQSTGNLSVGDSLSWSARQHTTPLRSPTGRLIRKIQGQEKLSEMYPPRSGPAIGAISVVIDQMASAVPRREAG